MDDLRDLLALTAARLADYRESAERAVFPSVDLEAVHAALGSLPDGPTPAAAVVEELVRVVEPALVATPVLGTSGS